MIKLSLSEIYEKVSVMIIDQLDIDPKNGVFPSASITGDLGADSLDIIELEMTIEEEFGISFKEKEVEEIDDVQGLVELINKKLV